MRSLRVVPVLLGLALLPGDGGCSLGGGAACTLIGCGPGLSFAVPAKLLEGAQGDLAVETCLDDVCETAHVPAQPRPSYFFAEGDDLAVGRPVEATLIVTDGTGDVIIEHREQATPTESWPNGKQCGPRCVSAPTIGVPGPSS